MLHDKKINIDLKREGRLAVLKLSDWGLGVEDHIAEFIFQPFFSTKDEISHPGSSSVYVKLSLSAILEHWS